MTSPTPTESAEAQLKSSRQYEADLITTLRCEKEAAEEKLKEAEELIEELGEFVADFVDGATDASSPRSKTANYLDVKSRAFLTK